MRRNAALAVSLALLAIPAFTGALSAQESPIVGAWVTTSWEGQDGNAAPGLLVFTETHYSMMFTRPGMVREQYTGETMTDTDIVAAFSTLVGNSGRYTRSGNEITTEAFVAMNPNYQASWGDNHVTYTFRVEGDTLHMSWPDEFMGPGIPGFTGTFRKVG